MKNNGSVINQNPIKSDNWGAEAILVKEKWFGYNSIKKIRIPKNYRIKQLDMELRNSRTITESKLLTAAKNIGVLTPYIYEIDLSSSTIIMEDIKGIIVKDALYSDISLERKIEIVYEIGKHVGNLHNNDLIHGDLTTSNILLRGDDLVFIDFGLGKFSKAIEDIAVDILLIKKCFISTHTENSKEFFFSFQEGYKETMTKAKSVFRRAIKVEARGRHLKEDQIIKDYLI